MSCPVGQHFATIGLLFTIGIPFAIGANGPVVPINPSDFPYLVKVTAAAYGSTPGVFISKRFVVAEANVATLPELTVWVGAVAHTVVSSEFTSGFAITVMKLCVSPAYNGPYYNFAAAVHSTFSTNETGKVIYYKSDGTLVGHTADVVTNPICQSQLSSTGGTASWVTALDVCIAFQATDCTLMIASAYSSYSVLAINGIVEGIFKRHSCAGGAYSAPTIYRKIMSYKTEILATSGVVVANP